MRIGIDFDNTIACYDGVFHAVAVERGLIPADVPTDKHSVRDFLRSQGRDADFTVLQGYVYGARMDLVTLYPGFVETLRDLIAAGHTVFLVSHKTKHAIAGPPYDLHAAARRFLETRKVIGAANGLRPEHVFFELTLEDKAARAVKLGCEAFVDDLPEILALSAIRENMRSILFDPDGHFAASAGAAGPIERYTSWPAIGEALRGGPPVGERGRRD
jgi:FMN phosphatase YigB (HAD superfamily)